MQLQPYQRFCVRTGRAEGATPLTAFDGALVCAGVGNYNLVKVSSIIPPRCQQTETLDVAPGSLLATAYASITCGRPGVTIAAAVSVALPANAGKDIGVIMECSGEGRASEIEERAAKMAREAMELRGLSVAHLILASSEITVTRVGAAFACVALFNPADSDSVRSA